MPLSAEQKACRSLLTFVSVSDPSGLFLSGTHAHTHTHTQAQALIHTHTHAYAHTGALGGERGRERETGRETELERAAKQTHDAGENLFQLSEARRLKTEKPSALKSVKRFPFLTFSVYL